MKTRPHKRFALFALLLLGLGLPCVVWIRKEQWQYALNRQLIDALEKDDTKQALALVNAGADPNTWEQSAHVPTWVEIIKQSWDHSSPPELPKSRKH